MNILLKIDNSNSFLIRKKYEVLLVSLILLLFGQLLIPAGLREIFDPLFFILSLIAGLILFNNQRAWFNFLFLLLCLVIILDFFIYFRGWEIGLIFIGIIYILYFISVSIKVYGHIYKTKDISVEMISSVFTGFVILGIIGGIICMIIEIVYPNSFTGLNAAQDKFQDLIYFSFITILTIGYGDITPVTEYARKTVMFLGLVGHFYSVFVVGIVIGKYLNSK